MLLPSQDLSRPAHRVSAAALPFPSLFLSVTSGVAADPGRRCSPHSTPSWRASGLWLGHLVPSPQPEAEALSNHWKGLPCICSSLPPQGQWGGRRGWGQSSQWLGLGEVVRREKATLVALGVLELAINQLTIEDLGQGLAIYELVPQATEKSE